MGRLTSGCYNCLALLQADSSSEEFLPTAAESIANQPNRVLPWK